MTDPIIPLDPETQLGYMLVRGADQLSRAWHGALRAHSINPRQFSMLACLAHDPGLSQGELARRVMITPQSVSESLSGLIDAGVIARTEAERGRSAQLALTAAGRKLLAKAYPIVEQCDRDSFAALTKADRSELARLLRKLVR
jgi:DNA-binding MarR family transcriptional regulator